MNFFISFATLLFLAVGSAAGQNENLEQRVSSLESCSRCRLERESTNATYRQMLLAVGGMTPEMDSVELYDPVKNSWKRVQHGPRIMHGQPLMMHGASAGSLPAGKSTSMVYLCTGGMGSMVNCYRYDPELDTWYVDVPEPKKTRMIFSMAVPGDGFLYKVGGMGQDHFIPSDRPNLPIERYDPVKNYWKLLATLPNATDSQGKSQEYYPTVATGLDGIVYIAGHSPDQKDHSEAATIFMGFNPVTKEIKQLAEKPPGMRASMSGHPLVGVKFASTEKSYVYALDSCGTRLDRYDVTRNRWRTLMLRNPLAGTGKEGEVCELSGGLARIESGGEGEGGGAVALFIGGGNIRNKEKKYSYEQSKTTFRLVLSEDFDSQATRWTQLADLNSPRSEFSMVPINKLIED